ncbi:meiotically up-regulated gene 113-domain-containing protein, partial [Coniella lustricola]
FTAGTPESRVKRTDSKNPATTCRGVTGSGRPCRRALDSSSPKTKSRNRLAVDDRSDPNRYCWQHKDQAAASAGSSPAPQLHNQPILENRTSIDSLTGRLGLLQTASAGKPGRPQRPHAGQAGPATSHSSSTRPPQKIKEFSFCCFRMPLYFEDPTPPPRPQPVPMQQAPSASYPGRPNRLSSNNLQPASGSHHPSFSSQPASSSSQTSQTSQFLSLIPGDAPPDTAHKLLKELAKPVSKGDEEGYIYIFWLTPQSETHAPSVVSARSLLEPAERALEPSGSRPRSLGLVDRRPSDVLTSFANVAESIGMGSPTTTRSRALNSGGDDKKTVLLKIGRANNVMRRMTEWKRQCGYDLSLVRFYPYVHTGSDMEPRKMPHSHKVERLIHLELSGMGMRLSDRGTGACEACGKMHKEWFEIDATKNGVLRVDEAIRRWTDWDEGRGS